MKHLIFSFLFFLIFIGICNSQQYLGYSNIKIHPSVVTQTEPVICISPLNPQILFVSAVTVNAPFRSEGVYFSTNGGTTWFGNDTCTGQSVANHGGSPGIAMDNNGTFLITHVGISFPGVFSHYSTNFGASWSNAYTLFSTLTDDKGTTTADYIPSSPYYGRIYNARAVLSGSYPVYFSYSTNGGLNWISAFAVNNPPPQRCSGGFIKTGKDGKIYLTWAGVAATTPYTENFVGFAMSTNGGDNWSVNQNVYSVNGINGTFPSKNGIKVNGLPHLAVDKTNGPRSGWIYIVTTEKNLAPAGSDPDIILHYSSNNGTSWSPGIRVNQDALNNGKIQYFPAIDVDSTGAVNILFYDDRNTASDSAEIILARSQNGGSTWREYVISNHRFQPKPIYGASGGYQGDHIALQASGNKLYALWMDDYPSSGLYQVWIAPIDISTIAVRNISTEVPTSFKLFQNYPNPFNPITKIKFSIPNPTVIARSGATWQSQGVSLKVFDILGKEVAVLVNETLQPGTYETTFDGSNLPSGIYFYQLRSGNYIDTKKLVLLK
jgi:hypothetical protein